MERMESKINVHKCHMTNELIFLNLFFFYCCQLYFYYTTAEGMKMNKICIKKKGN